MGKRLVLSCIIGSYFHRKDRYDVPDSTFNPVICPLVPAEQMKPTGFAVEPYFLMFVEGQLPQFICGLSEFLIV